MRSRGGAVVEVVLWTALLGVLMAGGWRLSQLAVGRLRVLSATRLAAGLVGTGRVDVAIVDREVRSYLKNFPDFLPSAVEFSAERFYGVPSASFYKVMSVRVRCRNSAAAFDESLQVIQEEGT